MILSSSIMVSKLQAWLGDGRQLEQRRMVPVASLTFVSLSHLCISLATLNLTFGSVFVFFSHHLPRLSDSQPRHRLRLRLGPVCSNPRQRTHQKTQGRLPLRHPLRRRNRRLQRPQNLHLGQKRRVCSQVWRRHTALRTPHHQLGLQRPTFTHPCAPYPAGRADHQKL